MSTVEKKGDVPHGDGVPMMAMFLKTSEENTHSENFHPAQEIMNIRQYMRQTSNSFAQRKESQRLDTLDVQITISLCLRERNRCIIGNKEEKKSLGPVSSQGIIQQTEKEKGNKSKSLRIYCAAQYTV